MPAIPSWTIAGAFGIARTTGTGSGGRLLDHRGRDCRGHGITVCSGGQQAADLAEQDLDVLWLDGEHDHACAADRLDVEGSPVTSWRPAQLLGPRLAPHGDDDVGPQPDEEQAGKQRLADLSRAENRDAGHGRKSRLGVR